MPGRTGVEVHDWLAEHRPVLEKAFDPGALAALVQRVTAGP